MKQLLRLFQRGKAWKNFVQAELGQHGTKIAALDEELRALKEARIADAARITALEARLETELDLRLLSSAVATSRFANSARLRVPEIAQDGEALLLAQRGTELLLLPIVPSDAAAKRLGGIAPRHIIEAIIAGSIRTATLLLRNGRNISRSPLPDFLNLAREDPLGTIGWLEARQPHRQAPAAYFDRLDGIAAEPDLIDFLANGSVGADEPAPAPFDAPELLPPSVVAEPKRRSVLLLHNNYYHFNCLAAGLKARGWDALTVSLEAPDSPQQQFFHGQDLNLHDPDPAVMAARIRHFFRGVPERFGSLHFYGMGLPSFFPNLWENAEEPSVVPWDLFELRRHRMIIGYMPSGCLDGGLQSSIHALTGGVCNRCVWQIRPDICSDARNLAWNRKLEHFCDWVGLECDHATPERISDRTVYGPVVTALDSDMWRPGITPPDDMRIDRQSEDVLIYHAVGNYEQRRRAGRDIKGTGAVMAAVERLQAEGLPVRLVFAHDIPSKQVRFLQVQADIVVDQLHYGRYGANAREAMMLGKPTICRLAPRQGDPLPPSRPILEAPLLDATEGNIVDVLRDLVRDPRRREQLGRRARAFAVAWHGQDACAARYERVIDRIRDGLSPDAPDLYPRREDAVWLA